MKFEITVTRSNGGLSIEGWTAVWTLSVAGILAEMEPRMDAGRFRLAKTLYESWVTVIGFAFAAKPEGEVFLRSEVGGLRKLFEDLDGNAALVSAILDLGSHTSVKATRKFADEHLDFIQTQVELGDITCEQWVFMQLHGYYGELMDLVLGPALSAEFWVKLKAAQAHLDAESKVSSQAPS